MTWRRGTVRDWLEAGTDKPDGLCGCWEWKGGTRKNRNGLTYGRIYVDGKYQSAHRVSYEQHVGPIQSGHELDHLCRNTLCVNPKHLEPVLKNENQRRGKNGFGLTGKCRSGRHDMNNPENIYVRPDGTGRACHPCKLESLRDAWLTRKAKQ